MAPDDVTHDVVVVGLGAVGAATLYQRARRGMRVLGIDRFDPPHAQGSSHGGSRVTREAVGEGAAYVPLVQRTHAILAELEAETGEALLVRAGTLIVGSPGGATPLHGSGDFLATSMALAARFGITHEILDAAQLRARFPQFLTFRDTDRGYFEPNAGYIRPEAAIRVQLAAARRHGAQILTQTPVTRLSQARLSLDRVVRLQTARGDEIAARQVVVSAGAWAGALLGAPFDRLLTVTRQVMHWYQAEDEATFAPSRFPVFIWFVTDRLEDYFTGFPLVTPGEGIKMTASREGPPIDHERIDAATPAEAEAFFARHVGPNLAGLVSSGARTATCFYTNTPDNGFIIDRHPVMDRVMVIAACSGHGFKHAAGLGEVVAELLHTGRSPVDLAAFRLDRFAT